MNRVDGHAAPTHTVERTQQFGTLPLTNDDDVRRAGGDQLARLMLDQRRPRKRQRRDQSRGIVDRFLDSQTTGR